MDKIIKKSVVLVLTTVLLLSAVGVTVSVHICDMTSERSVSFVFAGHSDEGNNTCSACETKENNMSCNMQGDMSDDMCCNNEGSTDSILEYSGDKGHCCLDYTENIQFVFDALVNNISIQIHKDIVNFVHNIIIDEMPAVSNLTTLFDEHKGGISPPYESNYIHYISSILE